MHAKDRARDSPKKAKSKGHPTLQKRLQKRFVSRVIVVGRFFRNLQVLELVRRLLLKSAKIYAARQLGMGRELRDDRQRPQVEEERVRMKLHSAPTKTKAQKGQKSQKGGSSRGGHAA